MPTQSYENHTRWVPAFHFGLAGLILLLFVGAVVNLLTTAERGENIYSATLLTVVPVAMAMQFYFSRLFALRAQDRAIRAEENLRHYVLHGAPLDARLTVRQIVALRFASDDEFGDLVRRAAEEGMSPDAIKRAVADWRADEHRA